MKIKTGKIILVIFTFLGVYILLAGYLSIFKPTDIKVQEENKIVSEIIPQTVVKPLSGESATIESNLKATIEFQASSEKVNMISISVKVLDKNYELEINEGANVFDAMKKLQEEKENEFYFNYKEYPSLGIFIDEINGMKGKPNSYWMYYINGKEASVGVSMYLLKDGDSILWKQE